MKCISANKILMNIKYSSKDKSTIIKDAIDVDDDQKFLKFELNFKKNLAEKKNDPISEIDLENEVYRLQNVMKKINEEFSVKRKQLEDDCCEQLRKLNENADKTHRLQQDLEQGKYCLMKDMKFCCFVRGEDEESPINSFSKSYELIENRK